jgi:hypothetical protein
MINLVDHIILNFFNFFRKPFVTFFFVTGNKNDYWYVFALLN